MRGRLTEPGAIVIDEAELGRLGVNGVGDRTKIGDQHVRVVGLVHGLKSLTGPYVFCSIETARMYCPDRSIRRPICWAAAESPGPLRPWSRAFGLIRICRRLPRRSSR